MNEHAQALGRLGGKALKGISKTPEHKAKLSTALAIARTKRQAVFSPASTPSIPIPQAIPQVKTRRCQAAYCEAQGHQVQVHGMVAWLCVEHGPRV